MELDKNCFRCGDHIEGPFVVWGGFVKRNPTYVSFHFDCWIEVVKEISETVNETKST